MSQCQCGYMSENEDFQYCPQCGEKLPEPETDEGYVKPVELTAPRIKRIIDGSEHPVRLRVSAAIDRQGNEVSTDSEDANILIIHGIDPEDGLMFPLSSPGTGTILTVQPHWVEEEAANKFGVEEAYVVLEFAGWAIARMPGFFDGFSWPSALERLTRSVIFARFNYSPQGEGDIKEQATIHYEYHLGLFGPTAEQNVCKTLQFVYLEIQSALEPVWKRIGTG